MSGNAINSGLTNISSHFSVSVADAISASVNEIPDEPISKESGAPLAVPRSGRLSDKFSYNFFVELPSTPQVLGA